MPLKSDGLSPKDFTSDDITYQVGIAPIRIDVMARIDGVLFSETWERREEGLMAGVKTCFISRDDLKIRQHEAGPVLWNIRGS